MKNVELLSYWLKEKSELRICNVYGQEGFYYKINKEELNINDLIFLKDPVSLCKEAASLLGIANGKLDFAIAGRIANFENKILFEYFPIFYGFSVTFSLLSDEELSLTVFNGATLEEKILDILAPGWSLTAEDRLTKFELLLDIYRVDALDILDIVKEAKRELDIGIRSQPADAGGHSSDNYEWYIGGLNACNFILDRYER